MNSESSKLLMGAGQVFPFSGVMPSNSWDEKAEDNVTKDDAKERTSGQEDI